MDRNLHATCSWWLVVLVSVSTLTESRLMSHTVQTRTQTRTPGDFRPLQQSSEPAVRPRPRPVVVHCHSDSMRLVVQADLLDTGLRVDGRHLHLGPRAEGGGGRCGAAPSGEAEFTIQALLSDCGTKLSSTREKIIYSNVLVYAPEPSSEGLLRLDGANIPVECHYEKRYALDAISLQPAWLPSVSIVSAEDQIDFKLLLMTADWQFERGSYSYFLGDPVLVEVSVVVANHMPLRVYVNHCVATATPDAESSLRYDFIEYNGCLMDAYLTNSTSHFLPRNEDHKLRFQLEAFRFHQSPSNQVYITCYVKAVPVAFTVSSENRACSIIDNRWRSADGNDLACRSCDPSHRVMEPLPTELPKTTAVTAAWPPKTSAESLVQNAAQHPPANYYRVRPGTPQSSKHQQSSAGLMKRGADHTAERTVPLGPITVLPNSQNDARPSASKTERSPETRTT